MPSVARRAHWIDTPGSRAWGIHYRGVEMAAEGRRFIDLSIGDHAFPTHPDIVAAAKRGLDAGEHHYSLVSGIQPLREAIADYTATTSGRTTRWQEVACLPGAQNALFSAAQLILDEGDEIIVPEPSYVAYTSALTATGASIRSVPCLAEENFALNAKAIAAAIGPKTKAILINSPNNPTGAAYDRAVLRKVADLAIAHDLWILSDEVYSSLVYDGAFASIAAFEDVKDRTIILSSLSKSHAMTGWRSGWIVAPEELTDRVITLSGAMLFGLPEFIQTASVYALENSARICPEIHDLYRARRSVVQETLQGSSILEARLPQGGMFFMVDVRRSGEDAHSFAEGFLEKHGIGVMPGDPFGEAAAGHVRVSMNADNDLLQESMQLLVDYASTR